MTHHTKDIEAVLAAPATVPEGLAEAAGARWLAKVEPNELVEARRRGPSNREAP